jgi:hypothetical protein
MPNNTSIHMQSQRHSSTRETIQADFQVPEAQTLTLLRQALQDGENSGRAEYSLQAVIDEMDTGWGL